MPQYRMVDMFHSCTDEEIKDHILLKFGHPTCLQIVIATATFGMNIDCPDPEDTDTYKSWKRCDAINCNTVVHKRSIWM